jgi:hypothetical protein
VVAVLLPKPVVLVGAVLAQALVAQMVTLQLSMVLEVAVAVTAQITVVLVIKVL